MTDTLDGRPLRPSRVYLASLPDVLLDCLLWADTSGSFRCPHLREPEVRALADALASGGATFDGETFRYPPGDEEAEGVALDGGERVWKPGAFQWDWLEAASTPPQTADGILAACRLAVTDVEVDVIRCAETLAYTARLHLDGQVIGEVCNDGQGGETVLHPHSAAAEAHARSLPPLESPHFPAGLPMTLGQLCDLLALEEIERKRRARKGRYATLFRLKGDPTGEYRTLSRPLTERGLVYLNGKYGSDLEAVYDREGCPVHATLKSNGTGKAAR